MEPSIQSSDLEGLESTNMSLVQQLEENVAYLMDKLDGQSTARRENITIRNRFALDEELRTVPLTLRILEGQVLSLMNFYPFIMLIIQRNLRWNFT